MNEIVIVGVCVLLGFVITVIGLTRGGPKITPENRAEIARGLYEHFGGDARAEIARYYPEEVRDE